MTTAHNISDANLAQQTAAWSFPSAEVAEQITPITSSIDRGEGPTKGSGTKTYTSQSLTLKQLTSEIHKPSDPSQNSHAGVDQLFAYLTAILFLQVSMSKNQSTLDSETNAIQNSTTKLSEEAAQKAKDDLKALLKEIEAQKNESWLQKLFMGLAAAFLFIIGAITGQPELCVMSAFMLVMQTSGGQAALEKALTSLGPVAKIFCELLIAVGEAVLTGGISGAMQGSEEVVLEEVVESAASEGGESAGASAAVDVAVSSGNEAADESSTLLNKILTYLKGGKFPGGNLASQLGKTLMMGSFWQDAFTQIAKDCGASDETANEVGTALGMIVGLLFALGASFAEGASSSSSSIKDFFTNKMGDSGYLWAKNALKAGASAMGIASSSYGIKQAETLAHQSDIQKDQATTYLCLEIYQGLLGVLNQIFTQIQGGFTNVQKEFGDIWQNSNKYLTPYDPRSYSA